MAARSTRGTVGRGGRRGSRGPRLAHRIGLARDRRRRGRRERFSIDRDWMPRLVLLAKSTYVWLDQLSKQYGRAIGRLDEIPDEELDRLARLGASPACG